MYAHYATQVRTWGPTVLQDQQLAGGLMWVIGDLTFLAAILYVVLAVDAAGGSGHGPVGRAARCRERRTPPSRGAARRSARPGAWRGTLRTGRGRGRVGDGVAAALRLRRRGREQCE